MTKAEIDKIRKEFPILQREVNGNPLVYLDNAATSQKPQVVLDAIQMYYTRFNANVHRGIHTVSQEATSMMEDSRRKVKEFINAKQDYEVIFTKGTTEGINLVAYVLREMIKPTDEIIISELEHHSNIVPWQILCERTGATLKYIPMKDDCSLDIEKLDSLLTENTKIVAINHVSNALGVINPIETIIQKAHQYGAWVLIDAAQSAPHFKIDVQALDVDFLTFSSHKMYGPTGVGILYGKEDILNALPPFHGGGEMIKEVTMQKSTYAGLPFKYEAGTPDIAGNIVLGTAIDYINSIGLEKIHQHEEELINTTIKELSAFEEVIIYGKDLPRSGAVSFNLKIKDIHPSDVGMILDKKGVAVRTGHHCAQPIMNRLGILGTVRASFGIYNTEEDIEILTKSLQTALRILA